MERRIGRKVKHRDWGRVGHTAAAALTIIILNTLNTLITLVAIAD
jgi:hypothetical protein